MRPRTIVLILAAAAALPWRGTAASPRQEVLALDGDVSPVHDPAVIKEGGTYYVFCTGGRAGSQAVPVNHPSRSSTVSS